MEIVITIVVFLAILSVLVLIHEFGHFIVARMFGVHVEEFGLGFPPRVFGRQKGKTLYSLNWIPLGGFVKLKGEQGESNDTDSFASKKVWQRICILAAGVFMNYFLTVAIFTATALTGMPQILDDGLQSGGTVREEKIQITAVLQNYPAANAGMLPGDAMVALDKQPVTSITQIQEYMKSHAGENISVEVARGSDHLTKEMTPVLIKESGAFGIGIGLAHTGIVTYPPLRAFAVAITTSIAMAGNIFSMLGNAVRHFAFDGFVGPVGIAVYTSTVTKLGFAYLLNLIAQLSLSLAVINFLPIPALDGGRALFVLIEKFRGRSVEPAVENAIHMAGFAILLCLLVLVTIRDIAKLF